MLLFAFIVVVDGWILRPFGCCGPIFHSGLGHDGGVVDLGEYGSLIDE